MRLLRILAPVVCVVGVLVTRQDPFAMVTARSASAERSLHRTVGHENVICRLYLDPHDKFTRVEAPPRRMAISMTGAVESAVDLSNITVNYIGFTGTNGAAAQAAFQAAVDIWKQQVASTVPIVVDAEFEDLGTGGLLGSAGSAATRDFPGTPRPGTWFPFPLANKIVGSDVGAQFFGPGASNIGASFNSNPAVNWSFATDGVPVASKVDFMSVVMHELGHGLGFFGGASASVPGSTGTLGSGGFPYIYDTFAADAPSGGNLLINLANPSTTMGTALTSNSEYWDGSNGKSANGGARPRLYAPNPFQQGSSHSHLDDATYPAGNANSLMTPSIGSAEIAHNPGPIMLGIFADMGWGANPCVFNLNPTSASVVAAGVSGTSALTVTVTGNTGCAWTASTASSFLTVTSGASGSGNGTVRIAVAANTGFSARSGTVTIAGQTFTVNQAGTGPTMSLDRASLAFSAVTNGIAFSAQTSAQAVRLVQTGSGTVTWTASSNAGWLTVSPTSGSGSATLQINTQFVANLAPSQTGTITLTFTGAGNTAGPITVTLTTISATQAGSPFGSFDTPANGTTGIAGSIAVTGWALDDIEVTRVRIFRAPVTGETPGQLVLIGDAVLVEGARPDVQAANPTLPRNTRAGWGYLMLTNFLPALGNGTFTIHAIAEDADGHSTTLGSKIITCDNASSISPTGAIDTPAQGATVSGSNVINFGWVLSPGNRRADPPGGGVVRVVIDGAIVPQVPGGWTSRADLSALFPAAQYSGINTALGVASFNSTTMINGTHTIAWLVTDNLGQASGIGSRYIQVSNGSLMFDPGPSGATAGSNTISTPAMLSMPRAAAQRIGSAASLAAEVASAPADFRAISGRRGYSLDTPFQAYGFRGGFTTIQSEELDRIELRLRGGSSGQFHAGYMRVGDSVAPLPIGSALNSSTGEFTWQPGVGFVGTYNLVFVRWAGGRAVARQDVRVVLNPKGSNRVGPQVVIDLPAKAGSYVDLPAKAGSYLQNGIQVDGKGFVVAGWAADLGATGDSGVGAVHVWAYPVAGGQPTFVGEAAIGGARPDVAAVHGAQFLKSGYGIIVRDLAPGTYDLAVFAYSTVSGGFVPAKTVRVTIR